MEEERKKVPDNTGVPPRTSVYGSGAMGNLTPEAAESEGAVKAAEKIIKGNQQPENSAFRRLLNRVLGR